MIVVQFQSISKHLLTHIVATYITDRSTSLASYYTCTNSKVTLCLCMAGRSTSASMAMAIDFYYNIKSSVIS